MALTEVSNILWQERHLLERLLFKLTEEQMLLASGHVRWLAFATDEVEAVLEELGRAELIRALAVQGCARELGMAGEPRLSELAERAPAPWDAILDDHRQAFLTLADEVTGMARVNRELLSRGHSAIRQVLESLSDDRPEGLALYGKDGRVHQDRSTLVVNEVL